MKPIVHRFHLVLLAALLAGCATTDPLAPETLLGEREQKSLLAKARPASEFNFAPLPLGNGTIYIGSTLLRREQSATLFSFDSNMPVIEMMGRQGMQFLVDTASAESWIEYSSAARNKVVFLKNNGQIIPYLGQAGTEGASAYAGVVPRLRIDSIDLENVPFFVRMAKGTMEPVVYSKTAPRVDGVLGYDNLRQFESIQFDLQAGIIRISTSETYSPDQQRRSAHFNHLPRPPGGRWRDRWPKRPHRPRFRRRPCLCPGRHPRRQNRSGRPWRNRLSQCPDLGVGRA